MRPVIGITMGDPSGIGPEIVLKALSKKDIYEKCRPIVIGDASVLIAAEEYTGIRFNIHAVKTVDEAAFEYKTIDVLDMNIVTPADFEIGKVSAAAGNAAFEYVKKTIELAMDKKLEATVTSPLNKEAINLAGHHFSGHTEIYAYYTKTEHYTMMLAYDKLRVVHVSTHVSLREACDRVKKDRILEVIDIAENACNRMGIKNPKIAVAGLNPHCGENGLFGNEEKLEIEPAVKEAQSKGKNVEGPIPADSVFSKARGGLYDIVVAMYHDQGHIPIKVAGFIYNEQKKKWENVNGVNITLGLPIIRTAVDHGTAFDQAGKGTANEDSLVNAIDYAVNFALNRK